MEKFFIVGCPRSGTTMLQQALNRHSGILIPPETKFFCSFLGHSLTCQKRHVARLNADLQIVLDSPKHRIRSDEEARAFYERMATLYVQRFMTDVEFFGEKTPEHTGSMRRIVRVFPKARFIFIYRDGRDVALSLMKVPWMRANLFVNFLIWVYYYRILVRVWDDPQFHLHVVKYEDLVLSPAAELRKITDFLDLPYEAAIADGYGNCEGIPVREYPWKARALEKITPARVAAWRTELSPAHVGYLERLGGDALKSLGYELTTGGTCRLPCMFIPSLAWNLFRTITQLPLHIISNELCAQALYSSVR